MNFNKGFQEKTRRNFFDVNDVSPKSRYNRRLPIHLLINASFMTSLVIQKVVNNLIIGQVTVRKA